MNIEKFFTKLENIFCEQIKEEQDEYMKNHILNPNPNDWRDDRSWR